MSKTIRRKKGKIARWITTTWDESWFGRGYSRRLRTPEELKKQLVEWHSDWGYRHSGPSKWFRSQEHNSMKMLSKGELARFWKDPEHEIQVERRRKHDYWD